MLSLLFNQPSDGSAVARAAPGLANFTSGAGKATGSALALAGAGSAASASPLGKATGAAKVGALAATASFTAAPGHATAGQPATALAAPGIGTFAAPPGKAIVQTASSGGGVFGRGMVGVYAPRRPPLAAKLVSVPAVARALSGQGYTHSAPGRASGEEAPQFATAIARAAPGACFSQVPPGRAIGAVLVLAPAGTVASSNPAGRASGAAVVAIHAPQGRADLARGHATGLHNPTDEELAVFALLLDDLRAAA